MKPAELERANQLWSEIQKLKDTQEEVRQGQIFLQSATKNIPEEYLDRTVEVLADMLGEDIARKEEEFLTL